MRKIPLTQGQVALVDDDDFARFGHLKWWAVKHPRTFYAQGHKPGGGKVYLHRVIMGATGRGVNVDHEDHNGLNCRRRTNLRVCTRAQNMMNRRGHASHNMSGIRGVCWHAQRSKWVARIGINGKTIYLGIFANKAKARAVYAAANRKHFGKFGGGL